MQGDKQRPLAVETLGNDDEIIGVEHLAGTHDGIKRAESGVVEHDIGRVDACGNQIFAHRHRLVIALQRVIAAQQQIVHLAAVIGVQRALNTIPVILIYDASAVILGGAKHHTNLTVGEIL